MKSLFSHLFFLLLGLVVGVGATAVVVKKVPDVRAAVLAGIGCPCDGCQCSPNGKCTDKKAAAGEKKAECCEDH